VCRLLNEQGVHYTLIGGCAVFMHGYERTTQDIDMLVDDADANIEKIKKALARILPEACAELMACDVKDNTVVRMSGEDLVVDLLGRVGDVDYQMSRSDLMHVTINGVDIPVAGVDTMLKLKEGRRDIDKRAYLFLKGKKEFLETKK